MSAPFPHADGATHRLDGDGQPRVVLPLAAYTRLRPIAAARLRAENARLAHLAGQTVDLVVERNHYRERATTHRERIDWMQSVAAAAMRQGLAECRRLRARLADAAEEIDRHWSERRAVAARVGCYPGSDLGREVGDMVDAAGALMAELRKACDDRDSLRADNERLRPIADAARAHVAELAALVAAEAAHAGPQPTPAGRHGAMAALLLARRGVVGTTAALAGAVGE